MDKFVEKRCISHSWSSNFSHAEAHKIVHFVDSKEEDEIKRGL